MKEYKKDWYQEHRERILEKAKERQVKNREEIAARASEKITCECGMVATRSNISRHRKTQGHINKMLELNNNERQNVQAAIQQEAQTATRPVEQPEGYSST